MSIGAASPLVSRPDHYLRRSPPPIPAHGEPRCAAGHRQSVTDARCSGDGGIPCKIWPFEIEPTVAGKLQRPPHDEFLRHNRQGADVEIREQPPQGLGRNEVAIGDVVGFIDRNHQQRSGRIVRLNDKTVTLHCGQQQWRVSYGLLHRVLDSSAVSGETLELEVLDSDVDAGSAGRDE